MKFRIFWYVFFLFLLEMRNNFGFPIPMNMEKLFIWPQIWINWFKHNIMMSKFNVSHTSVLRSPYGAGSCTQVNWSWKWIAAESELWTESELCRGKIGLVWCQLLLAEPAQFFLYTIHFQSSIHFQLQFTCTWSGPKIVIT